MLNHRCDCCGTPLGFQGICWKCRARKERNAVLAMTTEQVEEMVRHLIKCVEKISSYKNPEFDDFWKLFSYRGICPPELQNAALQAGVWYPYELYYHAPSKIRDGLIDALLHTASEKDAGNLLCCLAMQGDDRSLETLLYLEKNPCPWRENLYVNPSIYAQCGGWTFDQDGKRRELIYPTCFPMVKGDPKKDHASVIGRPRGDSCPHCGGKFVDMLVLDCNDPRLSFLEIDGIFTATCCPSCVCFTEASFSRFSPDGGSTPLSAKLMVDNIENYVGETGLQELTSNAFVLGQTPVPPFFGANCEDVNTIGGFANWVQDWQYTACPDCGRPMKYLAQIQWDTVIDCSEGTLYIEVCPECRIASMHHQQT